MSLLRKHCLIFGRPNQSAFLQEEIKNETLYERAARVLRQFTSNFHLFWTTSQTTVVFFVSVIMSAQ